MNVNRRNFLQKAGLAAASPFLMAELLACKNASSESGSANALATTPSIKEFGLQLWTVKEDMAKDAKGTLKALADYGYSYVESFSNGGDKIFWDMTAADFKAYLDSINLKVYSSHVDPAFTFDPKMADAFKKLCDDAASIGIKYLINPYMGMKLKTLDDAKVIADQFNAQAEACKSAGIRFAYHNHHYTFTAMNGQYAQDILINNTDPALVDFEMDIYWVNAANEDPEAWLKKHAKRFKLSHVKDIYSLEKIKDIQSKEKVNPDFPVNASCVLGTGVTDFPKVLNTAQQNGVEYFIVEQERFDAGSRLEAVKADAEYLKKLVFA